MDFTFSIEEKIFLRNTRECGFPASLRTFCAQLESGNLPIFLILPPVFPKIVPLLLSVCLPSVVFCFLFYVGFITLFSPFMFSFHRCLTTAVDVVSSASPPPHDDISPWRYPFTIHKDIRNKNIGVHEKNFFHYTKDTQRENVAVYPNILIKFFPTDGSL